MANQETNRKLVKEYFSAISDKFQTGQAREHAYRPVFESLIKSLDSSLKIINDPSRSEHGNPDFVFLKGDITVGYAETKDVGADLNKTEKTNQMERYLGYSNLILTDYLEFRFFKNGVKYGENITIGKISGNKLTDDDKNFGELADVLSDFLKGEPEPIKSGKRLAEIMGGKARRIRDNAHHFLTDKADSDTDLQRIYESVQKMLIHDLTMESFADMYAQTLVYGLFVARYQDESVDSFSREEARGLVPESNPFLRQFFDHIAGANFNKRLRYIVDELCAVFGCANIRDLMEEYFKKNGTIKSQDPVIHFYEDFLKEYDANLRKKMGAYYTPLSVVRFIVRAIDQILQTEFGLPEGLADTSKLTNELHKVQILDPAVGTGTFISAVIRLVYERLLKQNQKGRWPKYVHHDLLPRIHGFELMMAAYVIAHLKLSIEFKRSGFTVFNKRLGIYLTNSLEQAGPQADLLSLGFSQSIAEEAKQAAVIKNEMPIMVVLGNPPYSGESNNANYKGNDIYKVEPTGGKLKERNSKWLNDDYVKFLRFSENMIEKTDEGIVAMVTAHGYIDNPTFRGMRWHLMKTFDEVYILDLHGNAKKKEKSPDGSKDENVFDIQQGVAIFIGIRKKNHKNDEVKIFRSDCFGKRAEKFSFLDGNSLKTIKWGEIIPSAPNYEWVIRDIKNQKEYQKGFSVTGIFTVNSVCIVSGDDENFIKFRKEDFNENVFEKNIKNITYRVFDTRYINYDLTSITRSRVKTMSHFLDHDNLGLTFIRNDQGAKNFSHVFLSNALIDGHLHPGLTYTAPLYLYTDDGSKVPNLKKEIIDEIEKIVGKTTPQDIFDYIYAVLYSPSYREKYKEFLKIDFPRVLYPKNKKQFEKLVVLGHELREIHLLESPKVNKFITTYPVGGSDTVEKILYKDSNVFINQNQYFGDVPEVAWNFYIGGYQPAQKWLKNRKSRTLTNEEIAHYQKIIIALAETDRIMKEINKVASC